MILRGYKHGAIPVDVKWDRELKPGDTFIAVRCMHRGIILFTNDKWNQLEKKFMALPMDIPSARQVARHLITSSEDVSVDDTGNIRMRDNNVFFLKSLKLKDEAIMIGNNDFAVIWNKEDWNGTYNFDLEGLFFRHYL